MVYCLPQEREKARKAKHEAMSDEEKKAAKQTKWPRELIFFLRTSELLQGLGSKLNTRHAYMRTMAAAARRGIRESVPMIERARTPVWLGEGANRTAGRPISYPAAVPRAIPVLEQRVRQRLGAMYARGAFLGLQVCVISDGVQLVDVAAGEMGSLNPRPVRPDSLFPCLGASRFVSVATVHALASRGQLEYDVVRSGQCVRCVVSGSLFDRSPSLATGPSSRQTTRRTLLAVATYVDVPALHGYSQACIRPRPPPLPIWC